MTEPTETPTKTVIRPKLENYVRAKSGSGKRSHRKDDLTARVLAGKSLEDIQKGANLLGIDHPKWSHLNVGQQRMLIGNAIRAKLNAKDPLSEQALIDVYGEPVPEYDEAAEAAAAAKRAEEAAAKKQAKADEKAAKEAARAAKQEAADPANAASGTAEPPEGKGKSKRGKKADAE